MVRFYSTCDAGELMVDVQPHLLQQCKDGSHGVRHSSAEAPGVMTELVVKIDFEVVRPDHGFNFIEPSAAGCAGAVRCG